MGSSALVLSLLVAATAGVSIPKDDTETQDQVFRELWNDEFVWKFDDLPTKGGVPRDRIPYSGHIYLDKNGGTSDVLRKYDEVINRNYAYPATGWEQADTSEARRGNGRRFRWRPIDWYGHCNGWSSAAIRHAEPEHAVQAYGTTFSPADIKGLLAEIYMYNDTAMLAGYEKQLNAGTLHAILANWIGRGSHPVVMDSDPGKEKWNYPIFSFASSSAKHSPREVEVRTNIVYAKDSEDREYDKSPEIRKVKSFHYSLYLNARGEIIGGDYYSDSDRIDFVWVPLAPKKAGQPGNEGGNPHLDVEVVLSLWRQSVSKSIRRNWMIVDPLKEDRVIEVADPMALLPRNIRIVPATRTARGHVGDQQF